MLRTGHTGTEPARVLPETVDVRSRVHGCPHSSHSRPNPRLSRAVDFGSCIDGSYRSPVDRYAVVEVAAVWTTLAQASQARAGCGPAWRNPVGLGVSMPGVAGRLPVMIRPMTEPNWTDQLSAWSNLAMAVFSAVVAVFAYVAWRTAKAALIASREASEAAKASAEAARAANDQARLDSREQTRPYVWVEVVPGLAGVSTYDVRIANTREVRSKATDAPVRRMARTGRPCSRPAPRALRYSSHSSTGGQHPQHVEVGGSLHRRDNRGRDGQVRKDRKSVV